MSLRIVRILLLVLIALEGALLLFGPQTKDHLPAIQAALAAKVKPDWDDDASMGIRYAAWINLALLLVLLGTSKWWARPFPHHQLETEGTPASDEESANALPIRNQKSKIKNRPWFWPLVLLAIVTCVALRLPLASKSLWWDESWVVLQVSHGKWRPDTKKPGQLKFTAHDWKRCAFYYQKPTNHVPMSLAQKASFTIWHAATSAKPGAFTDLAARMPALLASAAAVLLLALLMRQWGYPGAGIVAAFLLALHPWHIRYGVDARAYALVVPLCIAGMFAVTRILQTRGTAVLPWVAWGAVEFVWLWGYPNAAVDIAFLNLVLLGAFLFDRQFRWNGILRLVAVNVFAAMAFIQMFLPNLMQALRWAGNETVSQPLNAGLLKSTLSQLVFGVEYAWPQTTEAAGLISSHAAKGWSSYTGGLTILGALLFVLGCVQIACFVARGGFSHRENENTSSVGFAFRWLVVLTPVVSTMAYMTVVWATGTYFYPRFIIAVLPCVIAIVSLLVAEVMWKAGPNGLPTWLPQLRRWVAAALALALAIQVFPFWKAQIVLLAERPYAPLRDVTEFAEGQIHPRHPRPLIVCYGHGHETLPIYLPTVVSAVSKAELEKYMAQARSEQIGLLVLQGHTAHNRGLIPDGFELLDDKNVFIQIKSFAGIDPEFYYRVFEMK